MSIYRSSGTNRLPQPLLSHILQLFRLPVGRQRCLPNGMPRNVTWVCLRVCVKIGGPQNGGFHCFLLNQAPNRYPEQHAQTLLGKLRSLLGCPPCRPLEKDARARKIPAIPESTRIEHLRRKNIQSNMQLPSNLRT